MKLIDFHTHAFPEEQAEKAIEKLETHYNLEIEQQGLLSELESELERADLYRAALHIAAVSPEQVPELNNWLLEINNPQLVRFGTIHPDFAKFKSELIRLKEAGIRGIKLHPELQRFDITSEKAYQLYEAISEDFLVLFHIGDDRDRYIIDYSNPNKLAQIISDFPNLKVIAAHLGGHHMWQEAREHLIGRDLYLDTSSTLDYLTPQEVTAMIKEHGVDRVLFGSDYPLHTPLDALQRISQLDLTLPERVKILSRNGQRLLAEVGKE
ncbi:MAG: amidohydrolase family protein [Bacillota bacterium]